MSETDETSDNKGALTKAWEWAKSIHWSGVIIEDGALSIGRVMAWAVFGLLYFKWINEMPVQGTLIDSFWGLLIYNGGKKITGPVREYLTKKKAEKDRKADDSAEETVTVVDKPFED